MLSTHVASAALVSCGNTDTGTSAGGCKFSDIFDTAVKLIEYMLSGAAVIAVGGVVYGGVLMVSSAGSESRSAQGKKAVTNSLIGLAIILLALVIVRTLFSVLGFDNGEQVLKQPGQFINNNSGQILPVPQTPKPAGTQPSAGCGKIDFLLGNCK